VRSATTGGEKGKKDREGGGGEEVAKKNKKDPTHNPNSNRGQDAKLGIGRNLAQGFVKRPVNGISGEKEKGLGKRGNTCLNCAGGVNKHLNWESVV